MDDAFLSVIRARHCKRAFLDRDVPVALLEEVLRTAANAPSGSNVQMWQVAVLVGDARESLAHRLLAEFDADVALRPDYVNRPPDLPDPYQQRIADSGRGVLLAKGIARDDTAGRRGHRRDNYRFYGAPVAMIFHLPGDAAPGTFLEMGLFLQNVMLGLVACGLASCPQYSVAGYAAAIREELGLDQDRLVVCSLSVGYEDESAPVNGFVPDRAALPDYTRWYGHVRSAPDSV